MIAISEQRVVEEAFFAASLTYYKPSMYFMLQKHFREENPYSEATDVKLKHLSAKATFAYKQLLKRDITKIKKAVAMIPKEFDEDLWRGMLPQIRDAIKKTLGIDFKPRSIFFEDHFPQGLWGFEEKGASSVTIFEGQTSAGIYFLNKRVSSLFTPLLLIHEQLHSCLSQNKNKDQMYIEWFEEGLCMWFSMKLYYELTKNMDVLKHYKERCYIFSRVKDEHNFTRRYFEYMKIFSRLFLHGGYKLLGKLLVEYMSGNREEVNKYLLLHKMQYNITPKGIDKFLVDFCFYIDPEKLPPIEYLVLESLKKQNTSLEELQQQFKLPEQLFGKVIMALNLKGMVLIRGKEVSINSRKKDLLEKKMIQPFWPLQR